MTFDPATGKLLGAQAVGGAGVDKRIDVLAVAIQAGMTVFDLEEMELCFAPQFGSAKDPVNMAGDELRGRLAELPRGRPVVAYCQVGQRGYLATRILMQHGFDVSNLGGGYKTYQLHTTARPAGTIGSAKPRPTSPPA